MNEEISKQTKASEALWFLNDHPGINCPVYGGFMSDCAFCMNPVSKEGVEKMSPVILERGHPRFQEFAHLLDPEDKDLPDADVYVTYEAFYGKPWECDHVDYHCEVDFFAFKGNVTSVNCHDYANWNRYHGFNLWRPSLEDMLIVAASEVRKIFGPFDGNSFLTGEERQNHKDVNPFLFEPAGEGLSTMVHNPKHMDVTEGMINRRWLKWFWPTEQCQKDWGDCEELKKMAEDPAIQLVSPMEVRDYPWI